MHIIVLLTGLGSSFPLVGWFLTRWATKLKKRINKKYENRNDVMVIVASSDGRGEQAAHDFIRNEFISGKIKTLTIVGHSNGFRDGLKMAANISPNSVDYFAGIDMTLGEFRAMATNNIKRFHEFHAMLETADFAPDFDKRKHKYWPINKGHTAAASDKFVQDKIFNTINSTIEGS